MGITLQIKRYYVIIDIKYISHILSYIYLYLAGGGTTLIQGCFPYVGGLDSAVVNPRMPTAPGFSNNTLEGAR